ncbi:hypothetical protein [Litorivicinus lipolyticus]|nr:hypothetical protein [Litorivicinus lipolyticus]
MIPLGSLIAPFSHANLGSRPVVWGGSGFNVPSNEIDLRLQRVNRSLESDGQKGWRLWTDALFTNLEAGFNGLITNGPGMKIAYESDPGLIFSLGFDYENFLRIDVLPGELPGEDSDGNRDISFYYLFSSIRVYSLVLPRQRKGQINLVYSQPVKAFNRGMLRTSRDSENRFVLETLMGSEGFSTLSKFQKLVSGMAVDESFFEPRHLRVRSATVAPRALDTLFSLKLDEAFDSNFFASMIGVSANNSFDASVLPFVMTDYLSSTLRSRFDKEPEIGAIFNDMDDDVASFYVDFSINKVMRRVSSENASKQQIARGLSMDISFIDAIDGFVVFKTTLVRVEKREQVKGAREESWYRSNDSLYFYYVVEKMIGDFFEGVKNLDQNLLSNAGVRPQDATRSDLETLQSVLHSCRYGA